MYQGDLPADLVPRIGTGSAGGYGGEDVRGLHRLGGRGHGPSEVHPTAWRPSGLSAWRGWPTHPICAPQGARPESIVTVIMGDRLLEGSAPGRPWTDRGPRSLARRSRCAVQRGILD